MSDEEKNYDKAESTIQKTIFYPSEDKSRSIIAYIVVLGYLFLILANIFVPVTLFFFMQGEEPKPMTLDNVRDLMLVISSSLSGFIGILGFVMGYYFKSQEKGQQKN